MCAGELNWRVQMAEAEEFGWGVNFVSWSRWESTGDTARHRETQTAGVGKGWSRRESLGNMRSRWEWLGVVEVVVVHSRLITWAHELGWEGAMPAEEFSWGVNFVSWESLGVDGDTGRHRETQTAGDMLKRAGVVGSHPGLNIRSRWESWKWW